MNDILKAMEIKKLLDTWKVDSKEANRMMWSQFIILWWSNNAKYTERDMKNNFCNVPLNAFKKHNEYYIDTCKKCQHICNSVIAILHSNK